MPPELPSWFKGRQAKAEPAGENTLRVTAPNQQETLLSVRQENGRWGATLRAADGSELAATDAAYASDADAWEAAFELYRTAVVV